MTDMKQEKKKKEEKKKPMYSVFDNMKFIFSNIWRWDKKVLIFSFLQIPVIVLLPMLGIYMSKYVVELVTENSSAERLVLNILLITAAMFALNLLNTFTSASIDSRSYKNRFRYLEMLMMKSLDLDYDISENPDTETKLSKAFNSVGGDNGGTQQIITYAINIVSNLIGIISYAAIIFGLSPIIIVLLSITTVTNYYVYRLMNKWEYRNRDHWSKIDRKINYIINRAGEFSRAKDMRLYNITNWFTDLFDSVVKARMVWSKKQKVRVYGIDILSALLNLIRDGAAYAILIYKMVNDGLPISDFVLYFGMIAGFSGWLNGFVNEINRIHSTSLIICDMREYLAIKDNSNRGEGVELPTETCEIEFKDVSFKYLNNEKNTLDNISFKINKGEKIAIVGLNGAGKTTMVKLLCGLYRPTEGEVIVDGHSISEYNRDEYYSLFSVVFQDIHLLPVSIAKNIAFDKNFDEYKLNKTLELSGFMKKVNSLPNGIHNKLLKNMYKDATDLSGGEKQKLGLSRALYKDGKIIVLDEPTAALDPIAENEMYLKYNELTAGRTAVYISHRLSSTRFCDRIFFLDNGKIVEVGSHDELMKKKGKYAEMFDLQSHYYKENIENEEVAHEQKA